MTYRPLGYGPPPTKAEFEIAETRWWLWRHRDRLDYLLRTLFINRDGILLDSRSLSPPEAIGGEWCALGLDGYPCALGEQDLPAESGQP